MLQLAYRGNPSKYYKFLRWLNEKAFQDDIKDEKDFIDLQSWEYNNQKEQYDFEYRQNWHYEQLKI